MGLADSEEAVPGLTVDQDMRWSIAVKAVAYGLEGAEERIAAERARDPSDRGQRATIRAEASRPSAAAKAVAWERIHGEGYGSFHLTAAAMTSFFWRSQASIVEPYVARYFDEVPRVFATRDHPFARAYAQAMFPAYRADPTVLERSEALLRELGDSNVMLTRILRESNDELARSIACRAYALAGAGPGTGSGAASGQNLGER